MRKMNLKDREIVVLMAISDGYDYKIMPKKQFDAEQLNALTQEKKIMKGFVEEYIKLFNEYYKENQFKVVRKMEEIEYTSKLEGLTKEEIRKIQSEKNNAPLGCSIGDILKAKMSEK